MKWTSVLEDLPGMVVDDDGWDNRSIEIRFDDGHEANSDVGTLLNDSGMITHWRWPEYAANHTLSED